MLFHLGLDGYVVSKFCKLANFPLRKETIEITTDYNTHTIAEILE